MLDFIFRSKIRQKILRILFANPDKEFYLSEIARKVNTSAGNCQRELRKMTKSGILKSQKKVNLRMYSVDRINPFYKDLQNIINKTIGVEEELKRVIKQVSGIKYAFIFGSYVKDELLSGSDIDLFIIGGINENELIDRIGKLEEEIGREINYHIYPEKEFKKKFKKKSFLQNVVKNYIFLTNNQNDFKQLLKQIS